MLHTHSPVPRVGKLAFIEEARLCGRGFKRSEGMCPGFVVPLGRGFVENMRSWEGVRLGLHFEVVGEEERVAGRVVCGLGIKRNFCMCGRWSVRGQLDEAIVGTVRSSMEKSGI